MTDQDTAQRRAIDLIMVEDSAVDAELVIDALLEAGLAADVRRADDEPTFRATLDERLPDAILADWTLPNFSGRRALEIARKRCPEVGVIFVSGTISEVFASEGLRQGAIDYVYKHQLQRLGPVLIRAIDEARTQRSLHESEEKYRQLFENSRDALIVLMPPLWRFADANQAALQMFGAVSKADFAAFGPWDVSPERQPDGRLSTEKAQERIATALREGSHVYEWEHRRLNGETFPSDVLLTRIEASGQELLQATVRDISERKRAEEEIKALAKFPAENPDPIMRISTGGTLLYINESGSGQLPEWNLQVGKMAPPLLRDAVSRVLNDGSMKILDLEYGERTYSFSVSPVRDAGYANLYGRNITARKLAEEERRNLEKQLQQAMKMEAVGTLAGGIAHDFNNALTGIVGFGYLLRTRIAGDETALHDLDEIQRCAERAATLTRQLLAFARRQISEPVKLDLNTLIAELMRLIGKVVGAQIEVETSLGKNIPTIHADHGQIEQVLMNLCLNSRDAMPEGGRLVVETGDVYLDEEYLRQYPYMKTGRYALLTVSDTGTGMDEKTRDRVFEPFFTTKGPEKGTGLGLSMVYGIVKQHGGFIHLYSEPGHGTVFNVYFPAIEAQPDAVPEKRVEEILRGGTETILLAEDDEAICVLAERILSELGYTVLVARSGEEALKIFRRKKGIVLAVLDVVMPRKGGKEVFEEMHRRNPRLKVIFMSGYSANALHDSFVIIAGTPFLHKPFGPTILARKVREVLDRV